MKVNVRKHLQRIEDNKGKKEEGKLNLISFADDFPRLAEIAPGFIPGDLVKLLASTGAGKTKFAKFLSLYVPHKQFVKRGLKYHTIYLALEEKEEDFIDNTLVQLAAERYGINDLDLYKLNSYRKETMNSDLMQKLNSLEEELQSIMEHVTLLPFIMDPIDIKKKLIEFAEDRGEIEYDEFGNICKYTPNDPEERILLVTDHINLLSRAGWTRHKSLEYYSQEVCMQLCGKVFNWSVFNIQQTKMNTGDIQHVKAGKLEPDLDSAGDNLQIQRDDMLILGLYAPYKVGDGPMHGGYSVKNLQDKYRSLLVLKHRKGKDKKKIGLLFDGAAGLFSELPHPEDHVEVSKIYKSI